MTLGAPSAERPQSQSWGGIRPVERRGRDSNPRSRKPGSPVFKTGGFRPEIPVVERGAVTGGKPGGKNRQSSRRDLTLRALMEERVEQVARPLKLAWEGVGVAAQSDRSRSGMVASGRDYGSRDEAPEALGLRE